MSGEPRIWIVLRRACRVGAILAVGLALSSGRAFADGAHIALQAKAGSYTITLFTAPEPLVAGPADLSVLVQDAATGDLVSGVTVDGTLTAVDASDDSAEKAIQLHFNHGTASNKLLLAAMPTLPAAGRYRLQLQVGQAGRPTVSVGTGLPVEPDHSRRTTVLFAVGMLGAAILLFLMNQYAKQALRRRIAPSPD